MAVNRIPGGCTALLRPERNGSASDISFVLDVFSALQGILYILHYTCKRLLESRHPRRKALTRNTQRDHNPNPQCAIQQVMLDSKRKYGTREPRADCSRDVDREVDDPIRRTKRVWAGGGLAHEQHVAPTSINA